MLSQTNRIARGRNIRLSRATVNHTNGPIEGRSVAPGCHGPL